jgi:RNA polymerase sigma-70 factor (ECF subfamily)
VDEESTSQEAIRSLYERYANDIYRYTRLMLGNSSDAYDVVQEVFLRAFRSWEKYRHDANGRTWLMTIARNYIFDTLRKKRTERKYLSGYEPPNAIDILDDTIRDVVEAIAKLKITYRQVIVLRHIENFSIAETARILGWSENKVRSTTNRAMAALRKILHEHTKEVNIQNESGT